MTVSELKKELEELPDDAKIVVAYGNYVEVDVKGRPGLINGIQLTKPYKLRYRRVITERGDPKLVLVRPVRFSEEVESEMCAILY